MCVCVRVRACVCVRVRACVCVCARLCEIICVCAERNSREGCFAVEIVNSDGKRREALHSLQWRVNPYRASAPHLSCPDCVTMVF